MPGIQYAYLVFDVGKVTVADTHMIMEQ